MEQIHATKISSNNSTLVSPPFINHVYRHPLLNQYKPDKVRVVYNAAAKCNNLVSTMTCYRLEMKAAKCYRSTGNVS